MPIELEPDELKVIERLREAKEIGHGELIIQVHDHKLVYIERKYKEKI